MLTALRIENFALIDCLELQLDQGLTVLTGETGAGKSIILDALDAVLGGKVSPRLVRSGASKACLEAHFTITSELLTWLEQQNLPDPGGSLVCKREISLAKASVRSRCFLNDRPITRLQLEALRQRLVEITAQGQTLQVGSGDRQRDWLDGFGGAPLLSLRQQVVQAYQAASEAQKRLQQRQQLEQERRHNLDLWQRHYEELSQARLEDPLELEQLIQEQHRLTHSVDLQQQSYQVYQMLYENDGDGGVACADLLGQVETILGAMEAYDSALTPILTLVSEALTQVQEAGRGINTYAAGVEADPERLEQVEERLRHLKGLVRRYGRSLLELITYRDQLEVDLAALSDQDHSIAALETEAQRCQADLQALCASLSQLRQASARALEERLIAELKPLAMDRVQFQVQLAALPPGPSGADRVQFYFSPNPGEPLQPLAATASGGEMSRFLLALKTCFSQEEGVGTLVFDEIDVGVSGRVAQAIAEKLWQLGRRHQVLCVTHQPMVAALADVHWRVGKQQTPAASSAGAEAAVRTVVRIATLSRPERREELAQLAGGATHQEALAFAESLLSQAKSLRQSSGVMT
ncbi:MAG: DNA repair protein RecN [Cyanobacteria bacterium REEB459]|nr:DNA repair protein RecN [Cyanobacteria bacterium REEB459]